MEHEFDRYSQRSFRSNVSTVQRSKYHTVSNDFVECTRPAAPTPVPTYHTNKASNRKYFSINFCINNLTFYSDIASLFDFIILFIYLFFQKFI
jgi:hypothetical protein